MATLTIVKDDKWVKVDGVGLTLDAVDLPANVHAVQWDGSTGHIEYNDGTANETISSIDAYSTITNDHATKKAANDAADAEEATALAAEKNTYAYKRVHDETTSYASIAEQLDQQYHDSVNGTTTWKDGIAAVKAAHPK
tara:strand:+ start:315 stop:731 length:417 start_codon:yes stop_codon:yes gene_type:complete